jgi:hypothetical protein
MRAVAGQSPGRPALSRCPHQACLPKRGGGEHAGLPDPGVTGQQPGQLGKPPRRAVLLGGKMLGTITFLVLALCFAAVVALIVAVAAAQSRHVPTSAWFTGTGLGDLFRELGDLALATVGYSILGMALGQFVRSAVFAVIIGFAWLVAVENIITRIVPSTEQWLPGASITAVASGGAEGVDYAHGMILGAVYVVVAVIAAMTVFLRSDVTA